MRYLTRNFDAWIDAESQNLSLASFFVIVLAIIYGG